jgi:signal transduction histidine kinase
MVRLRGGARGRDGEVEPLAATARFPFRSSIERRSVVLASAAVLFAAVFVARASNSDAAAALALLYVVPIALVALELGLPAGVLAAIFGLGLVAIWANESNPGIDTVGMLTRAVAYLAVGTVAGRFGDRMRAWQQRQHRLLSSSLRLLELARREELPSTLAEEAERVCGARAWVEPASGPGGGGDEFAGRRAELRIPIELRGERYGTLAVSGSRSITAEDRASLGVLALQAAVAVQNARLLDSERERAAIQAALADARSDLAERGGQLRDVLARHEDERDQLAYELHEEAAQTLVAVLLGLASLEREVELGAAQPKLGILRSEVDSTLQSLRSLAVRLRPSSLALGLRTAIEQLGARAREEGFDSVTVSLEELGELSPRSATMIYRVVEEALMAVGLAKSVSVRTRREPPELVVQISGAAEQISARRLSMLKARVELIGGELVSTPSELHARVPLPCEGDEPQHDEQLSAQSVGEP